ncbi:ATP-grasp domain-containing protein [Streptomyces sp. GZWMJZ-114]|uniref:ATP-grasp domain-containing protein n=1 Tax=Streptomyces sp. GZWMJZ-114 TaxID=2494734 RepID=UPI001011FEBB|nr:ATP-grasp domain-containing protein [Streptomyces sp. GZWMJZ-114]
MSARPAVLVVAPGDQTYRGYCLEQAAAAYDILLLTDTAPTWEKPFIVDHAIVDLHNTEALVVAGRDLADRHPVAGALTWSEWHLVPTARLATALGLPTSNVVAMEAARNKARARTAFAEHGVPSASAMKATTLLEAGLATMTIGYPVVLKPAAFAGSIGVIRVDRAEDLPAAFEFASAGASQSHEDTSVLIEQYLDGPEVSVECVTFHGDTHVVAVTRKRLAAEPFFEEIGHTVDAADPLLPVVAPIASAAIKALGITDGVQHVEMRLVDGHPHLIEVNGRIGGDLIGYLVHLATGLDLPRIAADIACGTRPALTPTRQQAAGIRMIHPAASGTVSEQKISAPFAVQTPWLRRLQWTSRIGDPLLLPPEGDLFTTRGGYYIVTGHETAEVDQRLDAVADETTLTVGAA